MAIEFVVEDGTSKTDSTSYASVAQFLQYWENRGISYSSLSSSAVEGYLNSATEYIDNNYNFKGSITDINQALEFPRYGVVINSLDVIESDEIPTKLISATCYMAAQAITTPIEQVDNNLVSISIGPVTKSYSKSPGVKKYKVCNKLLNDIIIAGNKLVRVG